LKKHTLLAVFLFGSTQGFTASEIEGSYMCKGTDPYINKNYAGIITVRAQDNDEENSDESGTASSDDNSVFQLTMNYETGEKSLGTGFFSNNLLSVVFQDTASADIIGLQYYSYGYVDLHDHLLFNQHDYM
jgi:hypothetical protein